MQALFIHREDRATNLKIYLTHPNQVHSQAIYAQRINGVRSFVPRNFRNTGIRELANAQKGFRLPFLREKRLLTGVTNRLGGDWPGLD